MHERQRDRTKRRNMLAMDPYLSRLHLFAILHMQLVFIIFELWVVRDVWSLLVRKLRRITGRCVHHGRN